MLKSILRRTVMVGFVAVTGVAFLLGGAVARAQDEVIDDGNTVETESVEVEAINADGTAESDEVIEATNLTDDGGEKNVGEGENADVDSGEVTDRDGSAVEEDAEETEEESEPLMWPVIVSGVAIGVMFLVVILLNIRK